MVRAMCGVQLKDIKRYMGLIFMLGLKEAMDQLAMAGSVHWYGHVLRREGGHVFIRALGFEVEGQSRTWKKQVEKESMKVGLRREDALCHSKWSVGVNKLAARLR